MPLFLMRHGRTRLTGTFCGSSNPRLNSLGQSEAAAAARSISDYAIDVCHVSPQLRAKETAAIVCRRFPGVRPLSNPLLKEIGFGVWEGLRFPDVELRWPSLAQAWANDPLQVIVPGGESFPSLRRRVRSFLAEIKTSFESKNVLVVAHGGTLAAMVMELLKRPTREYPRHIQPTASIRRISGRSMTWVYRPC